MSVYLQPKNPIGNLTKLEFPYTPQVEYGVDVKYDTFSLLHTNYQPYAYARTENPSLSIQCKFTSHTQEHFNRAAFAIRFLQTYTKMNYGRKDPQRGQPPRILRFFGYGDQLFNDVPVVISKFNLAFPEDIDYISGQVDLNGVVKGTIERSPSVPSTSNQQPSNGNVGTSDVGTITAVGNFDSNVIYLPAIFTIHINLLVQQNLYNTVNEFNLNDFASGTLITKGYI
jgi:hypothetical protein